MLYVVTGPMFCGKSTYIIQSYNYLNVKNNAKAFKPVNDNRYSKDYIVNHKGEKIKANILPLNPKITDLDLGDHTHLYFDEVQFFDTEFLNLIESLVDSYTVTCGGLSQDSFGKPFGCMPQILSIADYVLFLQAKCNVCGEAATRTYRTDNNKDQVHVGGANNYEPRCFKCWKQKTFLKKSL